MSNKAASRATKKAGDAESTVVTIHKAQAEVGGGSGAQRQPTSTSDRRRRRSSTQKLECVRCVDSTIVIVVRFQAPQPQLSLTITRTVAGPLAHATQRSPLKAGGGPLKFFIEAFFSRVV